MNTELKLKVCELFEFGEDKWFDYEPEFVQFVEFVSAPYKEENAALREELRNVGAMIPCSSGGTFVNDPPDAIVDALARYMNEVRHENEALRKQIEVAREALVLALKEFNGLPHSLGYDITHAPKIEAAIAAIGDAKPASAEVKPFGYAECAKFHPPAHVTPSQEAPREVIEARDKVLPLLPGGCTVKTITFYETQWQLVPKEPTRNMEYAASLLPDYFDIGDEYRAMLAAAPTLDVAMSNAGIER